MLNGVIIAAKAGKDCGKTTAINSILFYLDKLSAKIVKGPEPINQEEGKPKDFKTILEYQGVRIGISSMGDPGTDQTVILDEFIKADCRIIICACRTKGPTKDSIDALKNKWDIRYITPADYGYISVDGIWDELMSAIRIVKCIWI